MAISKEDLAQILTLVQQMQTSAPVAKATAPTTNKRHSKILAAFKRKGFKDVTLRDAANPSAPFNVRPYGKTDGSAEGEGWIQHGRIVRKGEKGVMGLFHESQTDKLPVNKPAAAKEAVSKANGAKPTLTLNSLADLGNVAQQ